VKYHLSPRGLLGAMMTKKVAVSSVAGIAATGGALVSLAKAFKFETTACPIATAYVAGLGVVRGVAELVYDKHPAL
jgi:hypothetical protein